MISKDGTKIAYDKSGKGPVAIMVNGAFAYRDFYGGKELEKFLSEDFTFIDYDRVARAATPHLTQLTENLKILRRSLMVQASQHIYTKSPQALVWRCWRRPNLDQRK